MSKMKSLIFAIWVALLARSLAQSTPSDDFDWDSIQPAYHLKYHPCYQKFQCARLKVPLDWLDANNSNTVAIAILKLPATVSETDPSHGGSILINPGGPGGSGVGAALHLADYLQFVVDSEDKHYEIVGFDPRGIAFTTPPADCYFDPFARGTYAMQVRGLGGLVPELAPLSKRQAMVNAYGRLCGENLGGEGGILPFASTASVARDMVEIVDKIEELRQKEKNQSPGRHPGQKPMVGEEANATPKGPARLQYIGFSYGTVLGNTFASMFPGRVGRIVLDGVCDIDDYMGGTWAKNLQDTDKVIDIFYKSCFKSPGCKLRKSSDEDWHDIQDRVEKFMAQLALDPIPILADTIITYLTDVDFKQLIFISLYSPNVMFPGVAVIIDQAMNGNYQLIHAFISPQLAAMHDACPINGTFPNMHVTPDATPAILCGDGDDATGLGLKDWAEYIAELKGQSPYVGPTWSEIRFSCSNWKFRPKYRFTGPFETPEADSSLVDGKPAAPILFLSTSLDPVTPLRNAHAMSKRHPGSVVLEQDSAGHCAVPSSPSECTATALKTYFANGTLPEPGTVCRGECKPYERCQASAQGLRKSFTPVFGLPDLQEKADRLMKMYEMFANM